MSTQLDEWKQSVTSEANDIISFKLRERMFSIARKRVEIGVLVDRIHPKDESKYDTLHITVSTLLCVKR